MSYSNLEINFNRAFPPSGFDDLPPPYQETGYASNGWDGWRTSDPLDDEQAEGVAVHAESHPNTRTEVANGS